MEIPYRESNLSNLPHGQRAAISKLVATNLVEEFMASDGAGMINNPSPNEDEQTLREYLLPGALPNHVFSAKSIGKLLKRRAG